MATYKSSFEARKIQQNGFQGQYDNLYAEKMASLKRRAIHAKKH